MRREWTCKCGEPAWADLALGEEPVCHRCQGRALGAALVAELHSDLEGVDLLAEAKRLRGESDAHEG